MTLTPLGDSAVVLTWGEMVDDATLARVGAAVRAIERRRMPGVLELVPAFASVTVFFDLARIGEYQRFCGELVETVRAIGDEPTVAIRRQEIPVCYGGEFGPDLDEVAARANLASGDVVALHASAVYRVHAIGFAPGFPYLGGLAEALHTPRRATPRTRVAAGSVGIGGNQTGVYPLATPGGWNVIGQTPLRMFDPAREEPSLLRMGDEVVFRAIAPGEFSRLAAEFHLLSETRVGPHTAVSGVLPGEERLRIEVLRSGIATTLQDMGRSGYRGCGVPLSGAADPVALRVANWLVGNPEDAAALEFTLNGPELRFSRDALVALTGAEVDGFPQWRPVRVEAGRTLNFGMSRSGCRGYLAIAGGIEAPMVLGSRSTYGRAALGGYDGRALRNGDVLCAPNTNRQSQGRWHLDPEILPDYSPEPTVRVVRGAQAEEFPQEFFGSRRSFRVSAHSDRMGVRLIGEPLAREGGRELRSAPVVPGTIQVPPDGQPIVLLADAQTLGGYPQVAHVTTVDLPLIAQLRPGDAVRFVEVTLEQAQRLALARERALGLLREGLAQKYS